jgi:hypothetical protein
VKSDSTVPLSDKAAGPLAVVEVVDAALFGGAVDNPVGAVVVGGGMVDVGWLELDVLAGLLPSWPLCEMSAYVVLSDVSCATAPALENVVLLAEAAARVAAAVAGAGTSTCAMLAYAEDTVVGRSTCAMLAYADDGSACGEAAERACASDAYAAVPASVLFTPTASTPPAVACATTLACANDAYKPSIPFGVESVVGPTVPAVPASGAVGCASWLYLKCCVTK